MTAIRKYRERQTMTQAQLAKMLGVTPSAVTQWESGDRKPDIILLKKLSHALKCSTDQLLEPINV